MTGQWPFAGGAATATMAQVRLYSEAYLALTQEKRPQKERQQPTAAQMDSFMQKWSD